MPNDEYKGPEPVKGQPLLTQARPFAGCTRSDQIWTRIAGADQEIFDARGQVCLTASDFKILVTKAFEQGQRSVAQALKSLVAAAAEGIIPSGPEPVEAASNGIDPEAFQGGGL